MDFKLKKACKDCPFRKEVNLNLTAERKRNIAESLVHGNKTFSCHKTVDYSTRFDSEGNDAQVSSKTEQHCAGALIFVEQVGTPNLMIQIAQRLGLYNPDEIDRDVDIFESVEEMVNAHGTKEKS